MHAHSTNKTIKNNTRSSRHFLGQNKTIKFGVYMCVWSIDRSIYFFVSCRGSKSQFEEKSRIFND